MTLYNYTNMACVLDCQKINAIFPIYILYILIFVNLVGFTFKIYSPVDHEKIVVASFMHVQHIIYCLITLLKFLAFMTCHYQVRWFGI